MTTPSQPYPVVKRIPNDQPFVVHHSARKRCLLMAPLWLMLELVFLCIVGLAMTDDPDGTPGTSGGTAVLVFLGFTVVTTAVLGGLVWLLTSGGPVLAVGPAGLWIKTRPSRGQAIWLPWEAIALISRRRWSFDKMLIVKPHDPRAEQNLGGFTAFDAGMSRALYGSGFQATLNMADRKEAEILQAVAYFAANRVPLA